MSAAMIWVNILLGLACIVIGGQLAVNGATGIARMFGLSETLIGLTIVAMGTSLPELVTSIVAARKGQNDIAMGNVIGSNLFNIFLILGVSSVITPIPVQATSIVDCLFLIAISAVFYLPARKGQNSDVCRVSPWWQCMLSIQCILLCDNHCGFAAPAAGAKKEGTPAISLSIKSVSRC